jgi:hypothetical protein
MTDNKKGSEPKIDTWKALREPFPPEVVGKLPRGNVTLDYVGHAAVTDRLNNVLGPDNWNWEPFALDEFGLPQLDGKGDLWIKLMIRDNYRSSPDEPVWVIRLGYGDGSSSIKELIGDALRNAAMRFGIALDLWSKDELESTLAHPELKNKPATMPKRISMRDAIATAFKKMEAKGITDAEERKSALLKLAGVSDVKELTGDLMDHVYEVLDTRSSDELLDLLMPNDGLELPEEVAA